MNVGIFSCKDTREAAQWMVDEGQGSGIQARLCELDALELSSVQAIVCIAEQGDEQIDLLQSLAKKALSNGIQVIWAVDNTDPHDGAFRNFVNFTELDSVAAILQAVLDLQHELDHRQSDSQTEGHREPKRRLQLPTSWLSSREEDPKARDPERRFVPGNLPRVIAVGGPSGCGASFVALNLAYALDSTLMEGRGTGTLAKWLGAQDEGTREAFLNGKLDTRFALTATGPIEERELQLLAQVQETVVVDVGNDFSGVWKLAGTKVFVVTPDPQYRGLRFPEGVKRVLNRYPDLFPTPAEKVFQANLDLVIRDVGRDAILSLWAKHPWLSRQPRDVVDEWKALAGVRKEREQAWPQTTTSSW